MTDFSNPYAAPAEPIEIPPQILAGGDELRADQAIRTFAVLNFVCAGISAVGIALFALILVYGILYSGDTGEALIHGVLGCMMFACPFVVVSSIYLAAAIGLQKRRAWGYYLHYLGAILAAFTCLGLAYTVFALSWATTPAFRARLVH